jgi:hypothetical protein
MLLGMIDTPRQVKAKPDNVTREKGRLGTQGVDDDARLPADREEGDSTNTAKIAILAAALGIEKASI